VSENVPDDPGADASFWESTEAVERFAARDSDLRLAALLDECPDVRSFRVLDLGCAAGRNEVLLADRGFDFRAIDSSRAMVDRTRLRVASILGRAEAERRVGVGLMEHLEFPDGYFDLVVALGVLHQAGTAEGWKRAASEVSRVLVMGGLLLVASRSPRSRPEGRSLLEVPGEDAVFVGSHTGHHYLLEAAAHDAALSAYGLIPEVPTQEVRVETERGERVTINGLYRRVKI
jgi:SAM-dependent methyltransferase